MYRKTYYTYLTLEQSRARLENSMRKQIFHHATTRTSSGKPGLFKRIVPVSWITGILVLAAIGHGSPLAAPLDAYPSTQYLIATGYATLTGTRETCRRISETVARAELAKQIKVDIREHFQHTIRQGRDASLEQTFEQRLEETTHEFLRHSTIVQFTVDAAAQTCSSIAVMPKHALSEPIMPQTTP